jgi:hypothetical protein
MDGAVRWIVGIVLIAAILGLIAFARGTPEHGDTSQGAAVTVMAS